MPYHCLILNKSTIFGFRELKEKVVPGLITELEGCGKDCKVLNQIASILVPVVGRCSEIYIQEKYSEMAGEVLHSIFFFGVGVG